MARCAQISLRSTHVFRNLKGHIRGKFTQRVNLYCERKWIEFSETHSPFLLFTRKQLRIWNVRERLDVPAGAFRALVKATLQNLRIRNTAAKSQNNRHILVFCQLNLHSIFLLSR